ncbi:helicase, putative [Spiroplasma clarkii]|uniref:hypothetical protein n=1 Tax=Spiroplasma clarkii TaxID=2139 RepID=UPI000B5799DD|nr:hypothetical protein [Spiroplasma clarkii]ARU91780.1 helicase, putative [Spiroplasma clarkii]
MKNIYIKVDSEIKKISDTIDENIESLNTKPGLLSQNILAQLRTLVEHIALKILIRDKNEEYAYGYSSLTAAIKHLRERSNYIFLRHFHNNLRVSTSHYISSKDNSERLMYKYIKEIFAIKEFMKEEFNQEIIEKISEFKFSVDEQLEDYYNKILEKIKSNLNNQNKTWYRLYIYKKS